MNPIFTHLYTEYKSEPTQIDNNSLIIKKLIILIISVRIYVSPAIVHPCRSQWIRIEDSATAGDYPNQQVNEINAGDATAASVEQFVESISFDRRLAKYDIAGSLAHAQMLREVGLLTAAVLVLAGWVGRFVDGRLGAPGQWLPVLLLFLITVVTVLWRALVRGATYHAALQVSAKVIKPLARPDPWSDSLGGPGGPRYPLGGDEYEVSI